jgi:hypothetical protein
MNKILAYAGIPALLVLMAVMAVTERFRHARAV